MRKYSRQPKPAKWFLDQMAANQLSAEEIADLCRSYDGTEIKSEPQPRPGEKILHNLLGCKVTRVVIGRGAGTRFFYEVEWRGNCVQGSSPQLAFHTLRSRFPKPLSVRVGEILAFRAWDLLGDCLVPVATKVDQYTGKRTIFEGPILKAHEAPSLYDSNGLHSVKMEPRLLGRVIRDYSSMAYGIVGLLGIVVEHEDGYRSSVQIVRRIILRFPASAVYVRALADRYECEVVVEKEFRQ